MWAARIYALVWITSAMVAAGVYFGGFFNEMMQMIFGFFFSTLLAAGFIAVLPALVNEHFAPRY